MNTYSYAIKLSWSENQKPKSRIETGTATCNTFQEAVDMITDREDCPWEYKYANIEILSITKV